MIEIIYLSKYSYNRAYLERGNGYDDGYDLSRLGWIEILLWFVWVRLELRKRFNFLRIFGVWGLVFGVCWKMCGIGSRR